MKTTTNVIRMSLLTALVTLAAGAVNHPAAAGKQGTDSWTIVGCDRLGVAVLEDEAHLANVRIAAAES